MQPSDEEELRTKAAAVALEWAEQRSPPFSGEHKGDFAEVIEAAHVVADESRLTLQRWIDAGRRAGMSWAEVGDVLGISKQAAQQRFFRSEAGGEGDDSHDLIEVRLGATAFNEVRMLKQEGLKRNELVRTHALALVFRHSDRQWEYARPIAVSPHLVMKSMSRKGWTYVSSWFPFHYFKRPLDGIQSPREGNGLSTSS